MKLKQMRHYTFHAYSAKIAKVWYCAVLDSNGSLMSSQFSLHSRDEAIDRACCRFTQNEVKVVKTPTNKAKYVLSALAEIFEGRQTSNRPRLAMYCLTEFTRKTLYTVGAIPKGYVSTYSDVGNAVGVQRGGRAVGNVMANNPLVLVIPCHRVVRSDLSIGGYSGGYVCNPEIKRKLLEREGIRFKNSYVAEECLYRFNHPSKA